jgi:glycerophosphoryl diester phosphodiesterase
MAGLAIALVACGGSGDDSSVATTTTTAATTISTTTTTAAPAATSTTAAPPAPTIDDLVALDRPIVIAHAGGDQDHPHSTPYAYEQSVAAGADVLELDVQLTGDGVLVVQHDDTVDKTTQETGPVIDRTLAELQALDNAYWFSPECWPCQDRPLDEYVYRGVRTGDAPPPDGFDVDDFAVPTFRGIAERFPTMPLDVEIKGTGDAGFAVAAALADELVALDRTESTIVVSFDDAVLAEFRRLAPDVETSPGLGAMTDWFLAGVPLPADQRIIQIPPSYGEVEVLSPDLMTRAEAEGLTVWVWAGDASVEENQPTYESWLALGVDGLLVGRPAAGVAAVEAVAGSN